ncbi:MAG: cell envelope integrity protein CreD [Terrimonas sp.]|nr:cell envelope integrity protein CreD [Terrimonas sp.]
METSSQNPGTFISLLDKGKLFIKGVVIFFMALGLWIPTLFINSIINERSARQKDAINDISNKWASRQSVTGPLLWVPYFEEIKDNKGGIETVKRSAWFMPDKMKAFADIKPEKRHRSIYQVAVYRSDITISGLFNPLGWETLNIPSDKMLWKEAKLVFSVSDHARGINEDVYLVWDGTRILCNPLSSGETAMGEALAAPLPDMETGALKQHSFSLQFSLNGSQELLFKAGARETNITMASGWKDPSFTGIKLPDERTVSDSGFTASWKYMNRTVPMVWKDHYNDLGDVSFGAALIIPVDGYDKTERSVKYALLCIVLTFAAFFLIESIYKKPLHLIQYGLAGLALVLFYTLLLSISEYLGFNLAYLIAGTATIGLVAWFVGGIMKSARLATFIGFVLTVVYGYIFTIIQLQDFALLMGSLGLFVALAIIMYFSRKLQW